MSSTASDPAQGATIVLIHGMWMTPPQLIAGGEDHISPLSLNRTLLKLHTKAPSATELKEYPGRPHFMAGWTDGKSSRTSR
jgi:pimeloyl-ACP methyl ester carboxylesterase